MSELLVIRFSALGDVAMTVPVLAGVACANRDLRITFLTQQRFSIFSRYLPDNVEIVTADLHGVHSGLQGLERLLREIDYQRFDMVADLHDVWRTKYMRMRLCMSGSKVRHIAKGRFEKLALTRRCCKRFRQLPTAIERYEQVFKLLGLRTDTDLYRSSNISDVKRAGIGIAPFAAHRGKVYPLEKMEGIVKQLSDEGKRVYLFGGGRDEVEMLMSWEIKYANCECVAGRMSMAEEIALMGRLEVMVTMDSGNMHLASLVGTRVVSIWGATHPYAGFLGYGQKEDDCVQLPLGCRPCSIYGKKVCRYGDYHCLTDISQAAIINRIKR